MNASGLPDDNQVTTARDQALLGRTIQEHFPRYYKYFSTECLSIAAKPCAITITCSALSTGWMASRQVLPVLRASTW